MGIIKAKRGKVNGRQPKLRLTCSKKKCADSAFTHNEYYATLKNKSELGIQHAEANTKIKQGLHNMHYVKCKLGTVRTAH
jgi:hypothetical protein